MSDKEINAILTTLENIVAQDTAQRLSGNGGGISPKHHHAIAHRAITELLLKARIDEWEKLSGYGDVDNDRMAAQRITELKKGDI